MSRGGAKRRYRVRRKRKDSTVADVAAEVADGVGTEVVGEFGCCVVEAVGALSILVGLLLVPVYLLMG